MRCEWFAKEPTIFFFVECVVDRILLHPKWILMLQKCWILRHFACVVKELALNERSLHFSSTHRSLTYPSRMHVQTKSALTCDWYALVSL